jgi:hypothetical protein
MPIDWNQIAKDAANATDAHFSAQISSLTKLNDTDIEKLIFETGISKPNFAIVLKEIKDASKSNEAKATAIKNISKGLDVLVAIAGKLI